MICKEGRWALGVALLSIVACSKPGADPSADKVQAVVAAETAIVTEQPFTETIDAIGTVHARAGHVALLSAPAPARIANVLVAAGQTVSRNQVLVEFEPATFLAAAESAEAALHAAQLGRDRAQRLVDLGVAPRKDLEQADADLARAKADVVGARRLAELAVMRSPINGVVTRMTATLGASVDPAQSLVEIADPSAVDVLLSMQPADAARIRSGSAVALYAGQRATGDPLARGSVTDVSGIVDSVARTVAVRVAADHARRPLRIGETLFGQVVAAVRPRAITVPLESLVPAGDGFKVFVVDSANVVHARPITLGGRTDRFAEVLKGVSAGERVVTLGAFGVDDGARIVAPAKVAPGATSGRDSATTP
ncbi:MAG: efflux RND transporter periplasmic adaptor subunit [Gemmatimonadales bacterium]